MTRPDISAHNAAVFERPDVVDDYAVDGLWPGEQALVAAFFPEPPAKVLDIGCGTGRTTVGLAAHGYETVGVDLSVPMIARARELHPNLDFRVMDATRLAFDAESFDAVLFSHNGIDLVYPLADRIACFREIRRVLRPAGGFAFSTHSPLGHLMCGPPFGSLGWRYAAKFLAKQLRNPVRSEGYLQVPEGEGWLWTYAALPATTIGQLRDAGFVDVAARTFDGNLRIGFLGWRTLHTYLGAHGPGG